MANKQICLLLLSCLVVFINVWAQQNTRSAPDESCEKNRCSCCLQTANCSHESGICYGQCKVGYHGARCWNKCPDKCNECKDATSGMGLANCTNCKDGYYTTPEYYQCQFSCPDGCQRCSNITDCISCKTGYYKSGSSCSPCQPGCKTCTSIDPCSTCKERRYGNKCNFNCSINCKNTCDRTTGYCDTCVIGFTGNKCCMQGPGCQSCSSDSVCSECVVGKHGERCDRECSEKCADKICDMVNGVCITCLDGFQGMNCTILKPSADSPAAAIGAAVAGCFVILICVVALLVIRFKQRKRNTAPMTITNTEEVPTDIVCDNDVAIAAASNECSIYQTLTGSYNITDYEQLSLGAIYGDDETRPITKKKTGQINKLDASMKLDKANESPNQNKSVKPEMEVEPCKLYKASKASKLALHPDAPLKDEHDSDYYNSVASLHHSVPYSDLASHFDNN